MISAQQYRKLCYQCESSQIYFYPEVEKHTDYGSNDLTGNEKLSTFILNGTHLFISHKCNLCDSCILKISCLETHIRSCQGGHVELYP